MHAGRDWQIQIVDAATGEIRRLTRDDTNEARPIWSLSGKYIFWRSERSGNYHYLRRRWPLDGSQAEHVSSVAREIASSADDRKIYFTDDEQRSHIREMEIGTSASRTLDHIPPVKPTHWFLRGSEIIYGVTHEPGPTTPVYRASIAGGAPRLLCRLPVHGDGLQNLSVSMDLKEVVWNRLEMTEDLWILEATR